MVPDMPNDKRPQLELVQSSDAPEVRIRGPREVQTIGNCLVPYGYEVWQDGVYKVNPPKSEVEDEEHLDYYLPSLQSKLPFAALAFRTKVCSSCVWIGDFGYSIDTKEHLVLLCYASPQGTLHQEWVTRDMVATRRSLVSLSNLGVPANDLNSAGLVAYLAAFEAANRNRESLHVGTRVGWHETRAGQGWLLGRRWYGPATLRPDPRGQGQLAAGLTVAGTFTAWREKVKEVDASGAVARLTIGAAFAAPILRALGHRTFFWYLQGRSRFGKTALEKFAMSAWGDPRTLKLTFNTSQIGIAEVLSYYTDLPLFVDERQAAGEKFDFGKFIYDISLESGRVRAKRTGGTQDRPRAWKTLVIASGEEGFVSQQDRGGQRNRVVEIDISALPPLATDTRALHDFSEACHGHAGPRFLEVFQQVVNDPELVTRMLARSRILFDRLSREFPDMGEAPANIGVVAFGRWLMDRWVMEYDDNESWDRCVADAQELLRHMRPFMPESLAERGLQLLRDYAVSNPQSVINGAAFAKLPFQRNLLGFRIDDGTLFIATEADKILKKAGIVPQQFWQQLKEQNRLITGAEAATSKFTERRWSRFTVRRRLAGRDSARVRGYLVSHDPEALEDDRELPSLEVPPAPEQELPEELEAEEQAEEPSGLFDFPQDEPASATSTPEVEFTFN